jgi:hypothetical protein
MSVAVEENERLGTARNVTALNGTRFGCIKHLEV